MVNVDDLVGLEQRNADGSGNNEQDPSLGTAGSQLINLAPRKYVDGVGQPYDYANARHISNTVVAQDGVVPNTDGVSDLFTFFSQFIEHDIDIIHVGDGGRDPLEGGKGDDVADGEQGNDLIIGG